MRFREGDALGTLERSIPLLCAQPGREPRSCVVVLYGAEGTIRADDLRRARRQGPAVEDLRRSGIAAGHTDGLLGQRLAMGHLPNVRRVPLQLTEEQPGARVLS